MFSSNFLDMMFPLLFSCYLAQRVLVKTGVTQVADLSQKVMNFIFHLLIVDISRFCMLTLQMQYFH